MTLGQLILGFSSAIFTYILLRIRHKSSYWSRQGVKGPTFRDAMRGLYLVYNRKPLHEIQWDACKKFGKVHAGYEFSLDPVVVVADPDILKDIMIKDFHLFQHRRALANHDEIASKFLTELWGDEWRRVRHILTPTFTSGKMKLMFNMMNECVEDALEYLREETSRGVTRVELEKTFGAFTMDVIGRCCFATKVDAYRHPENHFAQNVRRIFAPGLLTMLALFVLPLRLTRYLKLRLVPDEVSDYFFEATQHLIGKRKSQGVKENDFVQLLIDAEHQDTVHGDDPDELHRPHKVESQVTSRGQLSDVEIAAQTMLFFAAGYETTAILLTHLFYELGKNGGMQEMLLSEIRTLGIFDYTSINSSPLLDSIISETLRLYPPATLTERIAESDYVIEAKNGQKFQLKKGMAVSIPIYAIHHDEDNFENPEVFDPKRFLPENRHKVHPCAYLPFGQGSRNCIGMRFALLETKLMTCKLLTKFRFSPETLDIQYDFGAGLLRAKPVHVNVQQRS